MLNTNITNKMSADDFRMYLFFFKVITLCKSKLTVLNSKICRKQII